MVAKTFQQKAFHRALIRSSANFTKSAIVEVEIIEQPFSENFLTWSECAKVLIDARVDAQVSAHASRSTLPNHADHNGARREQADAALAQCSLGNKLVGSSDDARMNHP